ncbi:MAG: site-specific integrase [Alphaproteobacteria bacterium]|jgi:integrase|nr:site-specific integrase [Alphaproteobacteria bacterium]MBT4086757.1 site-specific integrase [Alphaproteobacteria bacterium]
MGGKRLPGSKRSRDKHPLKIYSRNEVLWIRGSVRIKNKTRPVRESTFINTEEDKAWEKAAEVRDKREQEIRDELLHGIKPQVQFAAVAGDYIVSVNPGVADLRNIDELLVAFGESSVSDVTQEQIDSFYRKRFPTQSSATIRRHQNTLSAVLNHAVEIGAIDHSPRFSKSKPKRKRGAAVLKIFEEGEAELLIEYADPHIRPVLATMYVTGARVSSVIYLNKEHFLLVPDRGRVTFPDTKNDNTYSRALHDYAVGELVAWLDSRKDQHPEMFLTPKGQPYAFQEGRGGQIKEAFDRAKERVVKELRKRHMHERARVLAKATPHWFRHNFANRLLRQKVPLKTIMEAGMWESVAALMNYLADAPAETESLVRSQTFGTQLVQKNVGVS